MADHQFQDRNLSPTTIKIFTRNEIGLKLLVPLMPFMFNLSPASAQQAKSQSDMKEKVEFVSEIQRTRALNSDEFEIIFTNSSLGLVLSETNYQGFPIVIVKEVKNEELLAQQRGLRVGAILTKVGDVSVDGLPMKLFAPTLKLASRPLIVRFRDPSRSEA